MRLSKLSVAIAALALSGCEVTQPTPEVYGNIGSFVVEVGGVFAVAPSGARSELPVVGSCLEQYGGSLEQVPPAVRGTRDCRYAVPRGSVEVDVTARTLDRKGQPVTDLTRDMAFRIVPGDLGPNPNHRKLPMENGVGSGTVRASHLFGEVRVWVEDVEPRVDPGVIDGEVVGRDEPDADIQRSKATGVSPAIFFQEPAISTVQLPDTADNRGSPLVGQFVAVGRAPEGGTPLVQNCPDPNDPAHGKPMQLLVTGADNAGFYVTDLTACRVPENVRNGDELYDPTNGQTTIGINPEPAFSIVRPAACAELTGIPASRALPPAADGTAMAAWDFAQHINPGTFGSIYIYNYSYPEGLYPGDLLWTIAGSVQEFTSTTQMTFPSWTTRYSTRLEPDLAKWNQFLQCAAPVDVNHRMCGIENREPSSPTAFPTAWITDVICGQNTRNLKLESLESALVRVKNVRLPTRFQQCDFDGNGEVSFFCDARAGSGRAWTHCDFERADLAPDFETACNVACVTMQPTVGEEPFLASVPKESRAFDFGGEICTEKRTYDGFGQYVAEMAGPGDAAGGLDPSLTERYETLRFVDLAGVVAPVAATKSFMAGMDAVVWCSQEVRYRFGNGTPTIDGDPVLPAGQVLHHRVVSGAGRFSVQPTGALEADARCTVGVNPRTRMNLLTREAVPELEPSCNPDDADADKAAQCRALRAATFDVVGHLKHIQPGRPRWGIVARDADDLCCHPGPGLECPRPIKPCL